MTTTRIGTACNQANRHLIAALGDPGTTDWGALTDDDVAALMSLMHTVAVMGHLRHDWITAQLPAAGRTLAVILTPEPGVN